MLLKRLVVVVMSALLVITLSPAPASADTAIVSGKLTALNSTNFFSTQRYNSYASNYVYVENVSYNPGGGAKIFYLVTPGTTSIFARSENRGGRSYFYRTSNGSMAIPRGNFTLAVRFEGSCGEGCAPKNFDFSARLGWNFKYVAPQ